MHKKGLAALVVLAAALVGLSLAGVFDRAQATGNGAPSGPHYNLNIIGVPHNKTADMDGTQGHSIFVPLDADGQLDPTKIWLGESGEDADCNAAGVEERQFEVIDRNGTDADGASFCLPPADTGVISDEPGTLDECTFNDPTPDLPDSGDEYYVCGTGTTVYSVFARALGGKGGSATLMVCGYDDGVEVCSTVNALTLDSDTRPSKFQNVTARVLYLYNVYIDIDNDGDSEYFRRIPLFSDALQDYFWSYDNNGLKLLQMRFYWCETVVVEEWGTMPDGIVSSECDLTGNGK